jgi:hypothetical protein
LFTVPSDYPYHPDPIDLGIRKMLEKVAAQQKSRINIAQLLLVASSRTSPRRSTPAAGIKSQWSTRTLLRASGRRYSGQYAAD